MTFDLVIRGGMLVDGTGAPARTADVGVSGGVIASVGRIDDAGTVEVDADGALVAPGWVDIHTHYDGQATWDPHLTPSAGHGVTTVVMGNCGVGFAPVHPEDHAKLIELMEGVEDIPGTALHEGLPWDWQSFPEYLDSLQRRAHDIDFAAQVCHGPLRLFVMGQRGADREPATAEEIAEMGRIAADGVAAGGLGFTTSRTLNHRTSRGEPTPTLTAAREELVGIAAAIGSTGRGVLQVVSDFPDFDTEIETLFEMMRASGRPLSVSLSQSSPGTGYRRVLSALDAAHREGLEMRAQVAARAVGVLVGMQASLNPMQRAVAYQRVEGLPLPERVAALKDPAVKAAIVGEMSRGLDPAHLFPLGDPPNYEPSAEDSVAARAARANKDATDLLFDLLLEQEGTALLYIPFLNYFDGNLDAARELLAHPHTVPGLGDGGAHVGMICDGSFPTTLLSYWGRDRAEGRFDLPWIVQQQCRATAEAVGLCDRGIVAPGYKADLNVIDFDKVGVHAPRIVFDLPAGGKRLVQASTGYLHTFVSGVEVSSDGSPTGATPGRLVRGAQPAPASA